MPLTETQISLLVDLNPKLSNGTIRHYGDERDDSIDEYWIYLTDSEGNRCGNVVEIARDRLLVAPLGNDEEREEKQKWRDIAEFDQSMFNILHFYRGQTVEFSDLQDFRYTKIHKYIYAKNRWDKFLANRRIEKLKRTKLPVYDRIDLLQQLYTYNKNGDVVKDAYSFLARQHGTSIIVHPQYPSFRKEFNFQIRLLTERGDVVKKSDRLGLEITGDGVRSLEHDLERWEHHRENAIHTKWLVILTLILALSAVMQLYITWASLGDK